MTAAKLTSKQEAFAVAVAKGATHADAYRASYDATGMSEKTLHKRVGELLKHGGITGRISALRAPALERAALDVERTVSEQLRGAYGEPADELTWAAKLKALDMANRIHGLYKEDNRQKAPNIAIQVQIVKASVSP
jgi:DNA-binding Lrp family transcriptional regulator